ncbi:MAG: DUF1569 domain-containing protein [Chitinophagaceae bacterium]
MQNLFEPAVCNAMLARLEKMPAAATAQWGKMNAAQMLAHCQAPLQVALGEKELRQSLIGWLFGRMAKKQMLQEGPFKKNLPTDPSFIVKDQRIFDKEKQLLQSLIERFGTIDKVALAQKKHPFFGYMTAHEWGILLWKHLDHHLLQFAA